ncbi:MAG: CBS domain-containing protein [Gemmatimonadetes bacterium]|nr:CBS domain-containing protein [Gemmatimonadota bacterium]
MTLSDLLRPEHVVLPLQAPEVRRGVGELAQRLGETGALAGGETTWQRIAGEAALEATQVASEIVLIHLRTDAVRDLTPAIGVWSEPVPFEERGKAGRARVLMLILAPPRAAAAHLPAVAALSRALRDRTVSERLRAARSPAEVLAIQELGNVVLPVGLTVKDAVAKKVVRVLPDTPLAELAELMIRHRLDAVPVVGEKHEVLGIVTAHDLMRQVVPHGVSADVGGAGLAALSLQARELMRRSVLCVSEEQSLLEVANLMLTKNAHQFPVVREGALTGFITCSDVLRKLFGR